MKMLIFDFRESEREFFEKNEFKDFDITFIEEPLNEMSQLTEEQLRDTDIISVFINSSLTEEVISKFKNLRVIATRSTGYNHIDTKYCTQRNIAVFNVEQYGHTAVAQYTIGLMIALVRKMIPAYFAMQKNLINHGDYEGRNLEGMTLGLIGGGSIGGGVAKLAHAFGMRVLVYSYKQSEKLKEFVEFVDYEELLRESDVISLHIPYTTESYHLFNAETFNKMKDGVYIINTARGELIDVVALYENLVNGKVQGAALDVIECENISFSGDILPELKDSNSKCLTKALVAEKLLGFSNVILTPHIAYNTKESVETLLRTSFNNIRDYTKGMDTNRVC